MTAQATPRATRPVRRLRRPPTPRWFNWPRVVLALLLIAYWLFARALERIDGNLVLAGIFLPDLSTGQAATVSFSPWLRLLTELFHPRVLRHFIPIFVGWWLAVQAAVSLMQILYNCPDRKTAGEFLHRQRRDKVGRLELPYVVLPNTLESVREESILLRVGGPVQVVIPNGYAAVTERNARFLRVLPPGFPVLGRFEYLLGVVDLQPQSRTTPAPVSLLTREGIPVKAEIGLTFAIDPGDAPTPLRPFPFRPEAVRKAAYGGAVGANGKVSTWDGGPLGKAVGALSGWVVSHTLCERVVADASHDAHHLMTQAIIDKVWDKDGLLKDGIKPLRVHVGRLTPPDEVSQQFTEVWLAAQQKEDQLARANGTAELAQELAAVNAEGPMLIIQALADRLRQVQQEAGGGISGYVLAISLVEALRQVFYVSAREARAATQDTRQLPELSDVSQRLAKLEEDLQRPTVAFNPSRSE